jgi:uncharacterized membrane protein YGL010W
MATCMYFPVAVCLLMYLSFWSNCSFVEPTLAAAVAVCYSIFYMLLDIGAGLSWTAFLGAPLLLSAQAFRQVRSWHTGFAPALA